MNFLLYRINKLDRAIATATLRNQVTGHLSLYLLRFKKAETGVASIEFQK